MFVIETGAVSDTSDLEQRLARQAEKARAAEEARQAEEAERKIDAEIEEMKRRLEREPAEPGQKPNETEDQPAESAPSGAAPDDIDALKKKLDDG